VFEAALHHQVSEALLAIEVLVVSALQTPAQWHTAGTKESQVAAAFRAKDPGGRSRGCCEHTCKAHPASLALLIYAAFLSCLGTVQMTSAAHQAVPCAVCDGCGCCHSTDAACRLSACLFCHCSALHHLICTEMVPWKSGESSVIGSLVLMGTGLLVSVQPSITWECVGQRAKATWSMMDMAH